MKVSAISERQHVYEVFFFNLYEMPARMSKCPLWTYVGYMPRRHSTGTKTGLLSYLTHSSTIKYPTVSGPR